MGLYPIIKCIITSGGSGLRFAIGIEDLQAKGLLGRPKQYQEIEGEMILAKTIKQFQGLVEEIIVVIRAEDEIFFKQNFPNIKYCFGGKTRQASVLKGLEFLSPNKPEFVLITDGVRPFTSKKLITEVINEVKNGKKAVIPVLPIHDTVKKVINGKVIETLNREELFLTQTPQGFSFDLIYSLHNKYKGENFTDDSALCEKHGIEVTAILGEKKNIKITTKDDLR